MSFPAIPRRSATLILAVHNKLTNQAASSTGYELLMLQRSSESRFMPNQFVFPGGISEPTDFSHDWLELVGNKGLPLCESLRINAPFYTSYKSQLVDSLPAHIGFRICAIRETFEESGVLLVKPLPVSIEKDFQQSGDQEEHVHLSGKELGEWRREVIHNASSFFQLCKEIRCAPDIWSLYEWSNWVTPAFHMLRFNTMFYVAFLNDKPNMSPDEKEITSSLWVSPGNSLRLFFQNNFFIGPPQLLEMARLCRFKTINELKALVVSITGVEQIEPVVVTSKSGDEIMFFPPDFKYEAMRVKTYKHYQDFMNTTKLKDLKKIPLLQAEETTEELINTKDHNTYRAAMNYKTQEAKVACTLTAIEYNLPMFDNKFQEFKDTV